MNNRRRSRTGAHALACVLALAGAHCSRDPHATPATAPTPPEQAPRSASPTATVPVVPASSSRSGRITPAAASAATPAGVNVVGVSGIGRFASLTASERDALKTMRIVYLHQSVGQDLEDGAEANGFKFEYVGPDTTSMRAGLHGGIFVDIGRIANGEPLKKIDVFRTVFKRLSPRPQVASFSFGYADVRDADLDAVKAAYRAVVAEVKQAGAEFVHVTPPLVYSVEENPAKMRLRTFMLESFRDDVIFDLQDIESQDVGKRCEVGGTWRICPAVRSTAACPSKGQGIDGDGAGHLCEARAKEIARAMLVAFAQAGVRAAARK